MSDYAVTIITVTRNAALVLRNTLESVLSSLPGEPAGLKVEYLLIDGVSTDDTLKIAGQYEETLKLKILSEPDKGLYDAMNKGLRNAGGKYVWFLNAGDEIHDDQALIRLFEAMASGADIYYSDALFISAAGEEIGLRSEVTPHSLPKNISAADMAMGMKICHQAFVVKREKAPYFDTGNLSADLDWEIAAMKKAVKIQYLDFVLCKYLLGGLSTQRHTRSLVDRWRVLERHFGWRTAAVNHVRIAVRGLFFYLKRGRYW